MRINVIIFLALWIRVHSCAYYTSTCDDLKYITLQEVLQQSKPATAGQRRDKFQQRDLMLVLHLPWKDFQIAERVARAKDSKECCVKPAGLQNRYLCPIC